MIADDGHGTLLEMLSHLIITETDPTWSLSVRNIEAMARIIEEYPSRVWTNLNKGLNFASLPGLK